MNVFVEKAAEASASFYMQDADNNYLYVDGDAVKVSKDVKANAAYSWKLDDNKKLYSVALDRANNEAKYLTGANTRAASWSLVEGTAASAVVVTGGALTVGTATINSVSVSAVPADASASITVATQTCPLQASFNKGEYYFISGNNASTVWKGAEDGKVTATTAVNDDECLWAIEDVSANGVIRYKFKNKKSGKYATLNNNMEFIASAAYDNGMLLAVTGDAYLEADLTGTTTPVSFGIYKSTTENVKSNELNDILGGGFGLTILKEKDSKDAIEGASAFEGKLTAVDADGKVLTSVTSPFQLMNGKKYVALTVAN